MLRSALSLLACFVALTGANPVARSMVLHERRATAPSGFVASGPAPPEQILNLRVALTQQDISGLEQRLLEVSSPDHPDFRQWMSKEEVEAFVKPSDDTVTAVTQWLSANGVSAKALTPAGDWLGFSIPVSKANEMLEADYAVFTHAKSNTTAVRTLSYSVPAALKGHIDLIHPTTSFSRSMRGAPVASFPNVVPKQMETRGTTVPTACNTSITPSCLQELYGIPSTPATNKGNVLGVTGMDGQYASSSDLKMFLTTYRPDMSPNANFSLMSVDDGTNPQTAGYAGVEANLDIQYTMGIASGVPTTFISVGYQSKDGNDDGFLDMANALIAAKTPPQVVTTSYGFATEADLSQSLTTSLCNAYMQLSARGVSVLYASGDGGVAASPGEACSKSFLPTFPTCPYVTLVGATENVNPERGAELSAGGFSNYFSQPSFQSVAVKAYLSKLGSTYKGMFNPSGRAYPDVSAQGQRVEIIQFGSPFQEAGTSCSSPIFASVISRLNDELMNSGKPVLGSLNPWLYANPQMFNDITTGSNPGCGTNGFSAEVGWDPVTGLGTPNYPAMRTAAGLS